MRDRSRPTESRREAELDRETPIRRIAGFLMARVRLILAASLAAALIKLAAAAPGVAPEPAASPGGASAVIAHCRFDC
ncbi:hypothetical protein DDZ18_09720 [Marinicauda salina]|uniref:Uncharacterized protein n=1 Tax=Marinicauda salina TaxID=2135793 RepID=A0A2U2BSM0_9PROT|nr:hypothetical protein [Marinicauda salina]PWE16976.1 hypothetical protein DDZ18_09720 [Marinicauda salina]